MTDPRCESGRDCVARTKDGAALVARKGALCHGCVDDLQSKLKDLPAIREALKLFLGSAPNSVGGARVSGSREPATPINLHALDLMDECDQAIAGVGGLGVQVRDVAMQDPDVEPAVLRGVSRVLFIRRVWSRADGVLGLQQHWERRHAPCPDCGNYTLGMWMGSGTVQCTNEDCQSSFPLAEYEQHCIVRSKVRSKK